MGMKQVLLILMAGVMLGCGNPELKVMRKQVEWQSAQIADLKDDIKELKTAIDKLNAYYAPQPAGGQVNPLTGLPMSGAGGGAPAAGGPGGLPGVGAPGTGVPGGGSTVDPITGLPLPAPQNPEPQTRPRR